MVGCSLIVDVIAMLLPKARANPQNTTSACCFPAFPLSIHVILSEVRSKQPKDPEGAGRTHTAGFIFRRGTCFSNRRSSGTANLQGRVSYPV
jgi:hypothetical protein